MQDYKVICQGVKGAYSHKFAIEKLNAKHIEFVATFEDVAKAISCCDNCIGVLPLENSTAGSVDDTYKLLASYDLNIIKKESLKVSHCLLGVRGARIEDIKSVSSHPQALMQCDEFISRHGFDTSNAPNTAIASERLALYGDKHKGVISSNLCAMLYGLELIEEGVQDAENNYTRFIVLSKNAIFMPENNAISLICATSGEKNSLSKLIECFTVCDINMTKIESKNIANTDFEVNFYIDIEGGLLDENVIRLLKMLSTKCRSFKVLGTYKA